ncbi:MAG: L-threonylcarbamoyladenylate synthase [Chitinispirillaceae bacterium]
MIHYDVHPINPQTRFLEHAVSILRDKNGVCVYPTDTVYGIGACASDVKAVDRIAKMLKKDKHRLFSFICCDFSQISVYAKIDNVQFKLMKRYLPGPYTFILPATNFVPKKVCPKRKHVGIRIPDDPVPIALAQMLQEPLANTSVNLPGAKRGDPEMVEKAVAHEVDIMLDTGYLDSPQGSTIVDLTEGDPIIVRQGKGEWHG